MSTSRLRSVISLSPIAVTFCALSGVLLIASFYGHGIVGVLALFPDGVRTGAYWQLLTYALVPFSIMTFGVIAVVLLWLASYLEPNLGRRRSTLIYAAGAIVSGVTYVLLAPTNVPLVGGLFIVSAAGAAFLLWAFAIRHGTRRRRAIFLALSIAWVVWVVSSSPLYLFMMHSLAWLTGALVAATSVWPNSRSSGRVGCGAAATRR